MAVQATTRIDSSVKESGNSDDSIVLVYRCWLCTTEFFDKLSIIQHLKAKHGDRQELRGIERKMKVPICLKCGSVDPCDHQVKDSPSEDTAEEDEDMVDQVNINLISKPRVIPCITCGEPFPDSLSLREHRRKEHPEDKSYQCTYCTSTFVKHSHLVVHTRIHTGTKPFVCSVCGNRFPKSGDLKRHFRIHSGEKPFKCALCSQTFTQKCSLEKHAKIHAKHIGGQPCLICGLVFMDGESLSAHTQTTHTEVSWKCKTCGKFFAEERHLVLHEKSHLAVKSFNCSFCPRTFSSRSLLAKHEDSIHSPSKEIKCGECGKEFKRRENLTRHMQSHSGVKNHRCNVCGMAFTEKGSLTRHTKAQHDLLRPHVCLVCARAFSRKLLLRKHMERVHTDQIADTKTLEAMYFRCKLCKKLLKRSGITQHVKHHRVKGDTWEGKIEEIEPMEIKQEATDFEEANCNMEEESEEDKAEEKVSQWDSDSTVENSDTETEKTSGNRSSFNADYGSVWNDFIKAGGGKGADDLESVQNNSYDSGTGHTVLEDCHGNMFVEDSHIQMLNTEVKIKEEGC